MPDFCSSCKAPIRWAITESGRFMPFNPTPDAKGEWRLGSSPPGESPRAIHVASERRAELAGELLTPHWATCLYASRHRRRTR